MAIPTVELKTSMILRSEVECFLSPGDKCFLADSSSTEDRKGRPSGATGAECALTRSALSSELCLSVDKKGMATVGPASGPGEMSARNVHPGSVKTNLT